MNCLKQSIRKSDSLSAMNCSAFSACDSISDGIILAPLEIFSFAKHGRKFFQLKQISCSFSSV